MQKRAYDRFVKGHTNAVKCFALLPSGKVVSGSFDCTLGIWNPEVRHY